mgnify:CR=1 FL=1
MTSVVGTNAVHVLRRQVEGPRELDAGGDGGHTAAQMSSLCHSLSSYRCVGAACKGVGKGNSGWTAQPGLGRAYGWPHRHLGHARPTVHVIFPQGQPWIWLQAHHYLPASVTLNREFALRGVGACGLTLREVAHTRGVALCGSAGCEQLAACEAHSKAASARAARRVYTLRMVRTLIERGWELVR